MKCYKNYQIRAYLDGELPENKSKLFEEHLSQCPGCSESLRQIEEEVCRIKESFEILDPASIPKPPALSLEIKPHRKTSLSLVQHIIFKPVKIPMGVMVLFLALVLSLSYLAFAGKGNFGDLYTADQDNATQDSLYFFTPSEKNTIPVNFDLNKFERIKNPRIFVLKEEYHD